MSVARREPKTLHFPGVEVSESRTVLSLKVQLTMRFSRDNCSAKKVNHIESEQILIYCYSIQL